MSNNISFINSNINVTVNNNDISAAAGTNAATTATTTSAPHSGKTPTLRQQMKMLGKVERADKTPTVRALEASGDPFVEQDSCKVYSNGYASYDNGSGRTVFWLASCKDFEYRFTHLDNCDKDETMTDHKKLGKKYMRAQPWHMAVMLVGDHRVEENMANRTGSRVGTREEEGEDESRADKIEAEIAKKMHPNIFGNPEILYIRREEVSERLASMSEKQRQVFLLYYADGMTQDQIAEEMEISRTTVEVHLHRAEEKMKNFR